VRKAAPFFASVAEETIMRRKRIPEGLKNESRKLQRMANRLNLYICFCSADYFNIERVFDELIEMRRKIDQLYVKTIEVEPEYFIPDEDEVEK
jgi:hypothetical protein